MNYTKTYQALTQLNSGGAQYGKGQAVAPTKCSAMLPNHLQCWRAGDVLITTITTVPATDDTEASTTTTTIQMCYRHASGDEQQYQQLLQDEQNAVNIQSEADKAKAKVVTETEK